jgi:hypothetical protein
MLDRIKSATKIALFFTLLGPAIGGVLYIIIFVIASFVKHFSITDAATGLPVVIFFSYIFGCVPAFATGFIASFFQNIIAPKQWIAASGVIGFCIATTIAFTFNYKSDATETITSQLLSWVQLFGLPGFLAAAICAWVYIFKTR